VLPPWLRSAPSAAKTSGRPHPPVRSRADLPHTHRNANTDAHTHTHTNTHTHTRTHTSHLPADVRLLEISTNLVHELCVKNCRKMLFMLYVHCCCACPFVTACLSRLCLPAICVEHTRHACTHIPPSDARACVPSTPGMHASLQARRAPFGGRQEKLPALMPRR